MRRSVVRNGEDLRDGHAAHPPFIQRTEKEENKKNENKMAAAQFEALLNTFVDFRVIDSYCFLASG